MAAWLGGAAAGQYLAGYLMEKALSVDNVFVFAVILSSFSVPAVARHRVLAWGVLGALVLRAGFIVGGVSLLDRFEWMTFVFGGFLVVTGARMAVRRGHGVTTRPRRNLEAAAASGGTPVLRLLRRTLPMTDRYQGRRFVIRRDGRRVATPLLATLATVATTDVVFAADSIPAVLAVTRDPFLVFASNAFAVLGLRALFFLLAGAMERFVHLHLGLAAILVFVGGKMAATEAIEIPVWTSLVVIAALLGASMLASVGWGRNPLSTVVRFIRRSGRRFAVTIGGFALLAAGAVMLVTPGPGLLAILAGLALLATEYAWAERALSRTKERGQRAARRLRRRRAR